MPRKTGLKECVKCDSKARVGVYTSYYSLSNQKIRRSSKGRKTQVKGSFPARGYCIDCFLRLAEVRGVSKAERSSTPSTAGGRVVGNAVGPNGRSD